MSVIGKVIQVAGPAVDVEFPEGQIPVIRTAIRITSEGYNVPDPIDIICEVAQHIGESRVRTIALQPTDGLVFLQYAPSVPEFVFAPPRMLACRKCPFMSSTSTTSKSLKPPSWRTSNVPI